MTGPVWETILAGALRIPNRYLLTPWQEAVTTSMPCMGSRGRTNIAESRCGFLAQRACMRPPGPCLQE